MPQARVGLSPRAGPLRGAYTVVSRHVPSGGIPPGPEFFFHLNGSDINCIAKSASEINNFGSKVAFSPSSAMERKNILTPTARFTFLCSAYVHLIFLLSFSSHLPSFFLSFFQLAVFFYSLRSPLPLKISHLSGECPCKWANNG
jgi:hypothetical protein